MHPQWRTGRNIPHLEEFLLRIANRGEEESVRQYLGSVCVCVLNLPHARNVTEWEMNDKTPNGIPKDKVCVLWEVRTDGCCL